MGGGGGGTLAPPLDLPLNNLCKRNMKDLMKVITWACRPVGITQLCFLLFVLGISRSTCGTLTIFWPQLHTQGVKKFLNYLQNTIQTSNSIFFKNIWITETKEQTQKLLKNYTCTPCKMLRVPYETTEHEKSLVWQKNLLPWKTGLDFLAQ